MAVGCGVGEGGGDAVIDYKARRYIGSTDAGAILAHYRPAMASLAKYRNHVDVWLRLAHGIAQPPSDRMTRGLRVEPVLRQLYRDTVGPVGEPPGMLRHPRHDFIAGSPDGLNGSLCIEYKTTTIYARKSWGEPGTDLVPDTYATQCQFLMMLSNTQNCHLLVAFGVDGVETVQTGPLTVETTPTFEIRETAIYQLERSDALIDELEGSAVQFWRDFVETMTPPPGKPMHNIRKWQALLKEQQPTQQTEATP